MSAPPHQLLSTHTNRIDGTISLLFVTSNSQIAEGGCPCPTGQTKCGASKFVRFSSVGSREENNLFSLFFFAQSDLTTNYPGYCTDVCCDFIEQETCYDPPSCAPVSIPKLLRLVCIHYSHFLSTLAFRHVNAADFIWRLPLSNRSDEVRCR